jgi:hypothetical protein
LVTENSAVIKTFPRPVLVLTVLLCCALAQAKNTVIRKVSVLAGANGTELEITVDDAVTPNIQVVTGPDRLVIDFPNSTPASTLHNVPLVRGEVTGVRVGLFSAAPPVTRVVVDLKMPQSYQLFPSQKSVIVKLGPPETAFEVVNEAPPAPVVPQGPRVQVSFRDGQLKVYAEKATLAEVLNEIHHQTGADIAITSGAEQDQVIANYGPGPAEQVIAALLNGSRFNFVTVGAPDNPAKISSVILIPRTGGVGATAQPQPRPTPPPQRPPQPVEADAPSPQ